MSDLPQISEAEFEVMKIVWKHAPISTNEITDKLLQTTSWSPKTIQTLIKRLVTKGALTYEKQSRVFVYTPVVKESEYIGQESNSFLERYYDGDITAMLSAYIENDRLSETEIDTLRSLLSNIKNSNLRSRDWCKKTSAGKILCKAIVWCTDWKYHLFCMCSGFHFITPIDEYRHLMLFSTLQMKICKKSLAF